MLDKIKSFFEPKITDTEVSMTEKLHFAAAALMLEVAYADRNIESVEKEKMSNLLASKFDISKEKIAELITLAEEETKASISMYQFTSLVNKNFEEDERFKLITAMWEIAFADGDLDKYEEAIIRKIADLLYIPHGKLMNAKHLAKTSMS